ncbi:MAG: histone deacetylase family protein [Chloroflexota bacterium]|nr:histone deacetylase family protein [Chloroflexota bacterium]
MPDLTPVVHSNAHLAHTGLIELASGLEIPCWESPERAEAIETALRADGGFTFEAPIEHGREPILAVHDADLLDVVEHAWTDALAAHAVDGSRPLLPDTFLLERYAGPMQLGGLPAARHLRLGAVCFDTATPIVAGTWGAARVAVDVALSAAERVLSGAPLAYGLCRPPGHHAAKGMFGGYCYLNNAAIVAQWLVSHGGARKVAILDIDYHHGNGTQQLFWERGDVLYVSLHADPTRAYPYFSGYASERGADAGAGLTGNWPLPPQTAFDEYAATLSEALSIVAAFGADAPLVLSAGFDTHERDPIGDLALRTPDYVHLGEMIRALGAPVIVLQEGGYALDALGANALALLSGLRGG